MTSLAMKSLGDRRAAVRLEIVGSLWGSLQLLESVRVLNISAGGALIHSPVEIALEALTPVRLTVEGEQVTLDARVRHVRPVPGSVLTPTHYLIGLEFQGVPAVLAHALE